MAINKGYLIAKTDKESDEMYTPFYAVNPIVPYIPSSLNISGLIYLTISSVNWTTAAINTM